MDHNVPTAAGPVDPVEPHPDGGARTQLRGGDHVVPDGRRRAGIVHVIGPQMGLTQSGLGDRLRRFPHEHARSVRGARDRYRHERGGARARDADAAADTQDDGDHGRGRAASGVSAKDVILGIIRRSGPTVAVGHVIEYRGRRSATLDGGPDDDLQHVDRGRRARRHGCARRDDVRLPRGPPERADGLGLEDAVEDWRSLPTDDGATFDREVTIDAASLRPHVSGGPTRTDRSRSTTCPALRDRRGRRARARQHGYSRTAPRSATSDPTPSSSARAPTRGSRIFVRRAASSTAAASRGRAMVVPGSMLVKRQADARVWTRCSSLPDSNGATPDARCAWA